MQSQRPFKRGRGKQKTQGHSDAMWDGLSCPLLALDVEEATSQGMWTPSMDCKREENRSCPRTPRRNAALQTLHFSLLRPVSELRPRDCKRITLGCCMPLCLCSFVTAADRSLTLGGLNKIDNRGAIHFTIDFLKDTIKAFTFLILLICVLFFFLQPFLIGEPGA